LCVALVRAVEHHPADYAIDLTPNADLTWADAGFF